MEIMANMTSSINDTQQITYFTLTADGEKYRFHAITPVIHGHELQGYLEDNVELYYFLILKKMWPSADIDRMDGKTNLEKMKNWIEAGSKKLLSINGLSSYEKVSMVPFKHTHKESSNFVEELIGPEHDYIDRNSLSDEIKEELSSATTIAALRKVLQKIFIQE